MRKIYYIFMIALLLMLASCNLDDVGLNNKIFYYEKIDEESIAIGNVIEIPENGAVFIPYQIDSYNVSKLGFNSGLGFGGNGYLSQNSTENMFTRCYIPCSVNSVMGGYFKFVNHTKIFYGGKAFDLECFNNLREGNELYVLPSEYDSFCEIYDDKWHQSIHKANVIYHLNNDSFEDNVYYLDYYNDNELITYIPPIPNRDGFTFKGWYMEEECINEWDFENSKPSFNTSDYKLVLYSKWIKEK
ncbi:MAG: InlB B-repeat-containing protein [Acholeplasmatales bacterium]|nr:InlB B-repeat-containing protein [Acholeplasmatales bacterium]